MRGQMIVVHSLREHHLSIKNVNEGRDRFPFVGPCAYTYVQRKKKSILGVVIQQTVVDRLTENQTKRPRESSAHARGSTKVVFKPCLLSMQRSTEA